jgi:putative transposase
MQIYKTYLHNPPHLFIPNAKYFITGAAYKHKPIFRTQNAKSAVLKYMFKSFTNFDWQIEDWVILDNHYHLMASAPHDAETLSQVINNFHRFTSNWITKNVDCGDYVTTGLPKATHSKTKRWMYNYWDTCITFEASYYARLNYIWFNPVKHGYVQDPSDWVFGSYYQRVKDESSKIKNLINQYPCDKVKVNDEF